jgi:hypothetical protein
MFVTGGNHLPDSPSVISPPRNAAMTSFARKLRRLVKSSLQGLSAGLTVLEKTALPDDRRIRLTTIKTSVDSLLSLLQ